jgi:cytochrome c biogenesis factor
MDDIEFVEIRKNQFTDEEDCHTPIPLRRNLMLIEFVILILILVLVGLSLTISAFHDPYYQYEVDVEKYWWYVVVSPWITLILATIVFIFYKNEGWISAPEDISHKNIIKSKTLMGVMALVYCALILAMLGFVWIYNKEIGKCQPEESLDMEYIESK